MVAENATKPGVLAKGLLAWFPPPEKSVEAEAAAWRVAEVLLRVRAALVKK